MSSKKINLLIFSIFLIFSNCKNEISKSNQSDNTVINDSIEVFAEDDGYYEEYEELNHYFFKLSSEDLLLTNESGQVISYDDEINYSELPNLIQIYFVHQLLYDYHGIKRYYQDVLNKDLYTKRDSKGNSSYTQEFIDFFNSKVNYVYQLPLKSEDEKLNEIFNRIYYNNKDFQIYEGEKKYGRQEFYLSKDGTFEYGINYWGEKYIKSPRISLYRNENGYLSISRF